MVPGRHFNLLETIAVCLLALFFSVDCAAWIYPRPTGRVLPRNRSRNTCLYYCPRTCSLSVL